MQGAWRPTPRARDGGAAYQQLLRSGALCNAAQNTKALFHLSDYLSCLTRIIFCDLPFAVPLAGLFCDLPLAKLFAGLFCDLPFAGPFCRHG
jgi:hypothetical protein